MNKENSPATIRVVGGANENQDTAKADKIGSLTQSNTRRQSRKKRVAKSHRISLACLKLRRIALIQAVKRLALYGEHDAYAAALDALLEEEKRTAAARKIGRGRK